MQLIRFEEADSAERTQIGSGLTKPAATADRLLTDRDEGQYFLRHEDGCAVCGEEIEAGDTFYLDQDTGAILCAEHGAERRGEAPDSDESE